MKGQWKLIQGHVERTAEELKAIVSVVGNALGDGSLFPIGEGDLTESELLFF